MYQKSKSKTLISNPKSLTDIVSETLHTIAELVGSSLGPSGRPTLIEREGMPPLATKDGATIMRSIGLPDAAANIVVEAAKEICLNTAKEAGDGTTSAIILASGIVDNGHKFLKSNPKYNPAKVSRELKQAYNEVVEPFLKGLAIDVSTDEQLLQVAEISANGDKEAAQAVVEAVMAAGDDGTVLIHEGDGRNITVETIDGYVITQGLKDLGQIGPVFINDKANQQVNMDDGHVVIYDGSMNDLSVPGLIQEAVSDVTGVPDGKPIIVAAHSFADSVLDAFAKTTKSGLTIVPIKAPRTGLPNGSSMFLQDLAVYTSATLFDPGSVDGFDEDSLGNFTNATINMYETFITSEPEVEAIEARVTELKANMKNAFSEMDRSFYRAGIAKLTAGVSTILVGGTSDLEIREKKDRVEDAVEAVRSAISEGVVPGGGSVHRVLSLLLKTHKDRKKSWEILENALQLPFENILRNCGESVSDVEQILDGTTLSVPTSVFDANNHRVVEPFDSGIIEPTKVIRVSVENALSVASLLMTIGGIVCRERDSQLEAQMEMADSAFKTMMQTVEE